MAGTPRSARTRGKKVMWDDLVETQGSVSLPNTPTKLTSRTQFSRELGLVPRENNEKRSNMQENNEKQSNMQENNEKRSSGQENSEKRSIITKMQDTMKKWKQGSPSFKKKGQSQRSSNLGNELSRSRSLSATSRVNNGVVEFEEEDPEFHGAPMYQSERAPDIYKQHSADLKSVMRSPAALNRCKSQRTRPGFKSRIEEIADINRTKSDPLQLKTSTSELEQIRDMQRTKSDPVQLNPNTLPYKSMARKNNNNDDSNDEQYKLMIDEISEFMEPASNPVSKATQDQVDSDQSRTKSKQYRFNPINFSRQLEHCETDKTGTSNPLSPKIPKKVPNTDMNDNDSNEKKKTIEFVKEEESPTSKVLSEAALMIADSARIEIKPETYQLNQVNNLSAPIEPCKPVTEKFSTSFVDTCMSSTDSNTTNGNGKTVSEVVNEILTPAFNVVSKTTDELIEAYLLDNSKASNDCNATNASDKMVSEPVSEISTPALNVVPEEIGELIETYLLDKSITSNDRNMSNASDKMVSEAVSEISAPTFNVVVEPTYEMIAENYQTLISKDEVQKSELARLDINKPLDLAPISTKFADSTNPDNSKTESLGVNENVVSDKNDMINENVVSDKNDMINENVVSESAGLNENVISEKDKIIEPTINLTKSDSGQVELRKSVNSKPLSTNVTDEIMDHANNSTNDHNGYKTESDQTVKLRDDSAPLMTINRNEPAQLETKLVSTKEPAENLNHDNDTKNDADYKTVIDAVGEIMSPVYDKISNLTNKVTVAGYSSGLSFRDYLKSKRVIDQVKDRVSSLMKQDDLPVSSNPHAEEVAVEESDVERKRLQEYEN